MLLSELIAYLHAIALILLSEGLQSFLLKAQNCVESPKSFRISQLKQIPNRNMNKFIKLTKLTNQNRNIVPSFHFGNNYCYFNAEHTAAYNKNLLCAFVVCEPSKGNICQINCYTEKIHRRENIFAPT